MNKLTDYPRILLVVILQCMVGGCSVVYKGAGDVLTGYAEEKGVPYMLTTDDVALGCSMAQAFTPFLLSFSQVTAPPEKLAVLLYLMAGNCSEFRAWEEELRFLRAIYDKRSVEARDARIAQQRFLELAARRELKGYQYFIHVFGEANGECPHFDAEEDELYWLLGLLNGIQAILNDIAAGGREGVPLSIAGKVGRSAACLDNEKWWGTPDAIQAAINIVLNNQPAGDREPMQQLRNALLIGSQQGMYVTQVLAAQVYLGQGQIEKVKNIIRGQVEISAHTPGNQTFRILNEMAKLQILAISDRMWTKATGQRTPPDKLGSFWDDVDPAVETIDIEEIM